MYATASTQGLLLSLSAALPGSSPLRRRAQRTAAKLSRRHPRTVDAIAAELLAQLLTATDTPELAGYAEDGVIDEDFDRL